MTKPDDLPTWAKLVGILLVYIITAGIAREVWSREPWREVR